MSPDPVPLRLLAVSAAGSAVLTIGLAYVGAIVLFRTRWRFPR